MEIHKQRNILESFLDFHKIQYSPTARLSHIGRKFRTHFPEICSFHPYPKPWNKPAILALAEYVESLNPSEYKPVLTTEHFVKRKKAKKITRSAAFINSKEWRELRYKVLVSRGRVCSACGTDNGEMHVDHIKPISKHWRLRLDESNLQVLCRDCNKGKGSWDETDWRK